MKLKSNQELNEISTRTRSSLNQHFKMARRQFLGARARRVYWSALRFLSILTWYHDDGDQEGRRVGGRRTHCTPRDAEHLHWAKSAQMGYVIFDSGLVLQAPFFS